MKHQFMSDTAQAEIRVAALQLMLEKTGLVSRGNFGWYIEQISSALGSSAVYYVNGAPVVCREVEVALTTWLDLHPAMDLEDYLREMFPSGLPVAVRLPAEFLTKGV